MEISRRRLRENFHAVLEIIENESSVDAEVHFEQSTALLAVVKANAYGHGVDLCAPLLAEAGAEWLGVTDAIEGAAVRAALDSAGFQGPERPDVLVMCGTAGVAGEAKLILKHRLIPVIWTAHHIEQLASAAGTAGAMKVHVEIDSGMSRQGVRPGEELNALLERFRTEPQIELDGLLTHFASTEMAYSTQTAAQRKQFEKAIEQAVTAGIRPRWIHAGNSSFIDNGAGDRPLVWLRSLAVRVGARSMVRSGLGLYGHLLPIEGGGQSLAAAKVLPLMTWKTRVIGLSKVPAGAAVGYNGTFVAQRPMRLALLPVGYADGFRRELSSSNLHGGGWVMIRGERAGVVGRVSMNLLTVDVSAIEEVGEGDEAILIGEGITADDHARIAGTIAYEILCGVRAPAIVTT